jgi:hypothetical protein
MFAVRRLFTRAQVGAAAVLALAVGLVSPSFATTTGLDLSGLTGAVNFSSVITAVVAIGGLIAAVLVAILAVRFVLQMLRRGS